MATPGTSVSTAEGSRTIVIVEKSDNERQQPPSPRLRLTLEKPKTDKRVEWTTDTVDNEGMGKKKSKCCCIYNKPRKFDESSSESSSDEECEHCSGHVEKRRKKKPQEHSPQEPDRTNNAK